MGWWASDGGAGCREVRSAEWDGPAPSTGDVLLDSDLQRWRVMSVAHGAGVGHFTLHVKLDTPVEPDTGRVFAWTERQR